MVVSELQLVDVQLKNLLSHLHYLGRVFDQDDAQGIVVSINVFFHLCTTIARIVHDPVEDIRDL